jgi:hypothetical protein
VNSDLTLEAIPFADDVGRLVKNLGKIASTFPLNQDGGHDNSQILERDSIEQIVHGGS